MSNACVPSSSPRQPAAPQHCSRERGRMSFPCAICFRPIPCRPWGVTVCGHVFHEDCCAQALAVVPSDDDEPNDVQRDPEVGPCPKCRVMTRFTRVYCPEAKDLMDENARLRVAHLVRDISGLRIQDQERRVTPSLPQLPKPVLARIFQHLLVGASDVITLQNIATTCELFRDVVGDAGFDTGVDCNAFEYKTSLSDRVLIPRAIENVEKWQEKDMNILLHYLGGAMGIRSLLKTILEKMNPNDPNINHDIFLRGDAIDCLTQTVQGNVIMRLEKANDLAIHRSEPTEDSEYPEVVPDDIEFIDKMFETNLGATRSPWSMVSILRQEPKFGIWVCTNPWQVDEIAEHIALEVRWPLARALSYQAGLVKLNEDLPMWIAAEIVHCMALITIGAYESGKISDPPYIPRSDGERYFEKGTDYFTTHCPPLLANDEGKLECIIVPRQIKDAAIRLGIKPVLGFGEFGAEWAPVSEHSKRREIREAREQYYEPNEMAEDDDSDYAINSDDSISSHNLDSDIESCALNSSDDDMEEDNESNENLFCNTIVPALESGGRPLWGPPPAPSSLVVGERGENAGEIFSEERLRLCANDMRDEWIEAGDADAKQLLATMDKVIASPNAGKVIVGTSIDYAAYCKHDELEKVVKMIVVLYKNCKVTAMDIETAVADIVEVIDRFSVDNPHIFDSVGDMFCAFANIKVLTVEWLCECTSKVVDDSYKPKVIGGCINSMKKKFGDTAVKTCFGGPIEMNALKKLLGSGKFEEVKCLLTQ